MFEPRESRARILIVDSDPRVGRSLSGILEASDRVEVVGCVSTAVEALDQALERCPDAVLIDLDESDAEEWLGLLSAFRCACSRAAIVVLSGAAALREVAIEVGADAFLTKYETADALAEAVAAIATSGSPEPAHNVPSIQLRRKLQ